MKLYFPFSFGKTNYLFKIICPLLFVFYSNLSSIRLSKIMCPARPPYLPARLSPFAFRYGSPGFGCRHCRLVGLDGLEPSTSRLSGARSSHLSYKPRFTHGLYDSIIFCLTLSIHLPARSITVGLQDGVPGFGSRHCRLVEMKGIEPLTPCLQGRCSPS